MPYINQAEELLVRYLIDGRWSPHVLDLGTGDGHLMALIKAAYPNASGVGLDISPTLVETARERFGKDSNNIRFDVHDLAASLAPMSGPFDVVISALAIHHLPDDRKRELYRESFALLIDGGLFVDVDVSSPTSTKIDALSRSALRLDERVQDPSDQPARLADRLTWLRDAGFNHVDCYWKWLDLAMVGGYRGA